LYNVNTTKIEHILTFMETQLFPALHSLQLDGQASLKDRYAFERLLHLYIEGVADIGNLLIDGFIMRDPGSYEDIVAILEDETVLPPEAAMAIKAMIQLRKPLIVDYTETKLDHLLMIYRKHRHAVEQFPSCIRTYLAAELW
jgi:uncharacterized protein YutE (UPF0331/DUF86 family)